jgi:DNA polymerase III sliding clamp (beta) subunit (PCNA family)
MKIKRLELLSALQAVSPGLASKEVIEQSTCFIFLDDQVITYNDEIAVSSPIEVGFEGAVPAKEFQALISKLKSDDVELELDESGGELRLKGSKAKSGFRVDSDIKLPIKDLAQPDDSDWIKLPASFCDAVSFCLFSVSKDQTKQVLTCIHVHSTFVESTDNFRVTRYDMGKTKSFKEPLLIPAQAARAVVGYKPTQYAKTDGWLHFKNESGLQFSCRIFSEEFPVIAHLMDVTGNKLQFPASLDEIMDRANVFSNGERITITAEGNKLTVASEGDTGWFNEAARITFDAEPIIFEISPEFMKSILKHTDTAELTEKLLKFSGENFTHVVALMKPVKKEKK